MSTPGITLIPPTQREVDWSRACCRTYSAPGAVVVTRQLRAANDRLRRRVEELEAEIERLKGGRNCPPGWEPEGLWRHDLGRPQKDKGPMGAW